MSGHAISIALATYNGGRFIDEQLESFRRQTVLPAELVVGDDRSSDDTVARIERFATTAPFPVRIHRNQARLGYRDNFLQTAERCSGTYVAFSDQDDVWLPEKLATGLAHLRRDSAVMFVHAATLVDAELKPFGTFAQGIQRDGVIAPLTLPHFFTFYGFSQIFRRDLLSISPSNDRPNGDFPFGQKISHDRWITFLTNVFGSISTCATPLVLYRRHANNVSNLPNGGLAERLVGQTAHQQNGRLGDVCLEHATFLAAISARLPVERRLAADLAIRQLEALGKRYKLRQAFYDEASVVGRLSSIVGATSKGAYLPPSRGGVGWKSLVKDVATGFALRDRLVG